VMMMLMMVMLQNKHRGITIFNSRAMPLHKSRNEVHRLTTR
jgi:hypothetical protein